MITSNFLKKILSQLNLKRNNSFFKPKPGLTFIGVGPGDPKLLTIAALDAIKEASIVAFPVAKLGGNSIAGEIAFDFIKHKKLLPLVFPMVIDPDELRTAWEQASSKLVNAVNHGEKVVLLCQGDPSQYATSSHILNIVKLNKPSFTIKVIPGITSFSAAAAEAQLPLALQREEMLVCTVPDDPLEFEALLDINLINSSNKVLVLLKLGKRWPWVKDMLNKKNLLNKTILAKRIGFPDQLVSNARDFIGDSLPYFSLLIIRNIPES